MTTFAPVRITLRLHRFEAVAFGSVALGAFALILVLAARLDGLASDGACIAQMTTGVMPARCELIANEFNDIAYGKAGFVSAIVIAVPFLAALLVGVAVVGRELERGTTRLAWSLTPSRLRWLGHRLLPVLAFVAVVGLISGVATDRLVGAIHRVDAGTSFSEFGFHGPVLAARAVWVFGVALVVGAVLGRALPALIVAGVIAVVGITGGINVHDRILRNEAVPIESPQPGDWFMDERFRLPDGTVIGWDQVEQYDPYPTDPEFTGEWPTLPRLAYGIPAARYGEVQLREIGALAGGLLVCVGATAFVVNRRRPG